MLHAKQTIFSCPHPSRCLAFRARPGEQRDGGRRNARACPREGERSPRRRPHRPSQAVTERRAGCSYCWHQSFVLSCLAPARSGQSVARGCAGNFSCLHERAPRSSPPQFSLTQWRGAGSLRNDFVDQVTGCTGVKLFFLRFGDFILFCGCLNL